MNATEALSITKQNPYRQDAVKYDIETIERHVREQAGGGFRKCTVRMYAFPGGFLDFEAKYGELHRSEYKQYSIEDEIREYARQNGYVLRFVEDCVLGGVPQDPFWEISW